MNIDWPKIQTVLLDMDGTLLDLHFDTYFWVEHLPKVYSAEHNVSHDDAMAVLAPLFTSHKATLNWYCVNFWSDQLKLNIMQHKEDVAEKIAYRPKAQDFLKTCRSQVNDLRLVTNGHREVLDLKIERTGIDQHFDQMVCSHELGAPKESVDYWHALQTVKPFDPKTTLFIDDSEAVLDSANDYGIEHIFSIEQPDSKKVREVNSKYKMIDEFQII